MKYTEADLYDGMRLWWGKNNPYIWNKLKETVTSKDGKGAECIGYDALKILDALNKDVCQLFEKQVFPLIFN